MQKRKDYQEDYDREMLEKLKEKHLELKQRREYNKKHKIVVPPEDRDPNGAFIQLFEKKGPKAKESEMDIIPYDSIESPRVFSEKDKI